MNCAETAGNFMRIIWFSQWWYMRPSRILLKILHFQKCTYSHHRDARLSLVRKWLSYKLVKISNIIKKNNNEHTFWALTRNPQILPCFSFRRLPRPSFLLHWAHFLGASFLSLRMSGQWNSGRKTTSKILKSLLTCFAKTWVQDAPRPLSMRSPGIRFCPPVGQP